MSLTSHVQITRSEEGAGVTPELAELLGCPSKLVECYRPWLRAMAASGLPDQVKSRLDESDIVQEVLFEACQDLEAFQGTTTTDLEAWLRQILQNQLVDTVRHHGRQRRSMHREVSSELGKMAAKEQTASALVRGQETREQLWQVLNALPEHYRAVILMRQQLDLTFVEIGERTNRSPDAARMLWGRAVLAMTEQLGNYDEFHEHRQT